MSGSRKTGTSRVRGPINGRAPLFNAFWSDPHFGHANIIAAAHRPFTTVEEMNSTLIKNYNEVVGKDDTCLWLGDCSFSSSTAFQEIMDQLNGRKVLVTGNHDRRPGRMVKFGFELVLEECTVTIGGHVCHIHHEPKWTDRSSVVLHGHTHSKERRKGRLVHLGVDAWGYKPATLKEVEGLVVQASLATTPQHEEK